MALRVCLLQKQTPFPYLHEIALPNCKIESLMQFGQLCRQRSLNYHLLETLLTGQCDNNWKLCNVSSLLHRTAGATSVWCLREVYMQNFMGFPHGIPREPSGRSDFEACFSRSNSVSPVTMVSPVLILTSIHKSHYII
jgi:hypothetical protein